MTFVAIGGLNGGSLFMRREFLDPKARIIGDGIDFRNAGIAKDRPSEKVIQSVQFFESIMAFAVNRALRAIPPDLCENDGESLSAEDIRCEGTLKERFTRLTARNEAIFGVPFIGKPLRRIFSSVRKRALRVDLRKTNDTLKRCFEY